MLRTIGLGVVAAVLLVSAGVLLGDEPIVTEQEKAEGFVPLFNGKDFTGWIMQGKPWEIKDGVMICPGKGYGWPRTKEDYENFVLRLEYKISPHGNSGIFIRAAPQGNPAFSGMEVQVLDDYGRPPNKHTAGALYAAVAPCKNASKPAGEWNEVEITCDHRRVKVVMNGVTLYDINLDDPELDKEIASYVHPVRIKGKDGKMITVQKPYPPLKTRARKGYIGLQNHGHRVEYRKIRIKVLD